MQIYITGMRIPSVIYISPTSTATINGNQESPVKLANECGHPLNLPFEVQSVDFLVKFTEHDIHICAFAEPCDDIGEQYDDYTNDMNDVEFDVRMTVEEKYALMLALFLPLLAKVKTKEKTPEPKRGSAAASTNQERMSEGQKKLMNTMSDLFPNIFKSNKDN